MFSYGEVITFVSSVLLKNARPRMRGGVLGVREGSDCSDMSLGAKDAICFLAACPVAGGGCKDLGFTQVFRGEAERAGRVVDHFPQQGGLC